MQVDFRDGEFVVSCSFQERFIPERAGFKWDGARKRWVTSDSGVAISVGLETLTDRAKAAAGTVGALPIPDGLEYLPFQEEGIRWGVTHPKCLIGDQPGLGKGHPLSTRILTPSGFSAIGSLAFGDKVIGLYGNPVPVTGIFERGVIPIFRVEFDDGATIQCDGEHLWTVYDPEIESPSWQTIDTLSLLHRIDAGEPLAIPTLVAPVQTTSVPHAVPPMIAGADLASTYGRSDKRVVRPIFPHVDPYTTRDYANGSAGQAVDFLHGVVSTLGVVRGHDRHIQIDIKSAPASRDLIVVIEACVRKLGGLVFKKAIWRRTRLRVYLPDDLSHHICTGSRYGHRWRTHLKGVPPRRIVSVTPCGKDRVRCISVDDDHQLYVAENYIVTHNTIQGVGIINAVPNVKKFLIIPPASLKKNWMKEFLKWTTRTDLSIDIAEGSHFPNSDGVIINYDILNRHRDKLRQHQWDIIIGDETQYLKNKDAGRTKEFLGGIIKIKDGPRTKKFRLEPIPANRVVLLSGTPSTGKTGDLWTTVQTCDPFGLGKDYYDFHKTYCGAYYDFSGFVPNGEPDPGKLSELNKLLRQRFMIRRLKADVLKDLPEKIRQIVPLPMDGLKKKIEAERAALTDLLDMYEKMVGIRKEMSDADLVKAMLAIKPETWEAYAKSCDGDMATVDMPLARLANARQELAVAKLPMVIEYVQNLLDSGVKVVVFGYHQAVIEGLIEAFKGLNPAVIYGKTPMKRRQAEADRFQEDDSCRLFIGQFTAAGTGYTLTQAYHNVFAELTWVPHELLQAEDRIHRIGSEIWDSVWAHHLVVEGSLDDTFVLKLIEKMRIIELTLD